MRDHRPASGLALLALAASLAGCAVGSDLISDPLPNAGADVSQPAATPSVPPAPPPASELEIYMWGEGTAPSRLTIYQRSLAQGPVTIKFLNSSGKAIHDVVVARVTSSSKPITMNAGGKKVDAAASGLSEILRVNRIRPGKLPEASLNLPAGEYIAYCNVAGHYSAGESARFTVSK